MWLALVLALALALASVISYDHQWCCNVEHHLLMTLASSFTIVLCLWCMPLYFFLCVYSFVLHYVCLFICPSFCMFIYLPVLLTLFYVRTSAHVSFCPLTLPFCMYIDPFVCVSVSFCLYVYLKYISPSFHLFIYSSVSLPVCTLQQFCFPVSVLIKK